MFQKNISFHYLRRKRNERRIAIFHIHFTNDYTNVSSKQSLNRQQRTITRPAVNTRRFTFAQSKENQRFAKQPVQDSSSKCKVSACSLFQSHINHSVLSMISRQRGHGTDPSMEIWFMIWLHSGHRWTYFLNKTE